MKKPTDKQRIDWLQRNDADASVFGKQKRKSAIVYWREFDATGKTLRAAIDAAMKLQARKAGK